MSNRKYKNLWALTGFVASVLFVATILLVTKARSESEIGVTGYITSPNPSIYLRDRPNGTARIVTILERDTPVYVADSTTTTSGATWYRLISEIGSGWVASEYVSFDPP